MRIPDELINLMYERSGVNRYLMNQALIYMGPDLLKPQYRDTWSVQYPTRGYCYNVTEFVFHYNKKFLEGFYPYVLGGIPNETGNHRYLMNDEGLVIDLTADQFPNWELVDYHNGKKNMFFPIKGGGPSKRTKILATHYFGN